ncbi:MAG: phenylacetate--CoA ligase family protein [Bacteroidota bacterium]|nr:phenylacetate--CoA ligase family protein [Bacteroidota bacterium]
MFRNFLLEKCILPLGDRFSGSGFMNELQYWRSEVGKLDPAGLKHLQKERLSRLLKHAVTQIPYYRNLSISLTNDPYADIRQFPVMHKNLMKQHIDELYVGDRSKMIVEKSSGSSGIQGEVYMTLDENRRYQAVQTFLWEWSGYRMGMPMMQTGMTLKRGLIKGAKDFLFQTHYVNAFELEYGKMVAELQMAHRKGCSYFGGYASSLNVYAEAAKKAGIDLHFKGVIAWGDKLFDHYKKNIAGAFGNPIITELYGTTEGFVISGTCEGSNHHQLSPQTFIELLDKDGNEVQPGERGFVVATRLDAFSFPLIRFYTGDIAVKEDAAVQCSCGRAFPLLRKIIGRDTDIIHTPSGKALIVHFFTGILEHFEEIKQFKVIQRVKEEIEIEYIPATNCNEEVLQMVQSVIYEKANEVFPIRFKQVQNIAVTASGKPQIIQNLVAEKLV